MLIPLLFVIHTHKYIYVYIHLTPAFHERDLVYLTCVSRRPDDRSRRVTLVPRHEYLVGRYMHPSIHPTPLSSVPFLCCRDLRWVDGFDGLVRGIK